MLRCRSIECFPCYVLSPDAKGKDSKLHAEFKDRIGVMRKETISFPRGGTSRP